MGLIKPTKTAPLEQIIVCLQSSFSSFECAVMLCGPSNHNSAFKNCSIQNEIEICSLKFKINFATTNSNCQQAELRLEIHSLRHRLQIERVTQLSIIYLNEFLLLKAVTQAMYLIFYVDFFSQSESFLKRTENINKPKNLKTGVWIQCG